MFENSVILFGIPIAFWAFLFIGAIGGYFAGRHMGYANAVRTLYIPQRDRTWDASDRMRARMDEHAKLANTAATTPTNDFSRAAASARQGLAESPS